MNQVYFSKNQLSPSRFFAKPFFLKMTMVMIVSLTVVEYMNVVGSDGPRPQSAGGELTVSTSGNELANAGAGGMNHTLNREPKLVCKQQTALYSTKSSGGLPQNDKAIAAVMDADKPGISAGATFLGTPDHAATEAIVLPSILQNTIPNEGTANPVRSFNSTDDRHLDLFLMSCPGNLMANNSFETGTYPSPPTAFDFAGGKAVDFGDATPAGWSQATVLGDNYWVQSSAAHSGNKFAYTFSSGTTSGGNDACNQISVSGLTGGTCYKLCVFAADAKADGMASGLSLEVQEQGGPFHYTNLAIPNNPSWSDNAQTVIPWAEYCYTFTTQPGTTAATIWFSAAAENGGPTSYLVLDDACLSPCPPPCTPPTAISLTKTAPTCAAGVAQNDGKIILNSIMNADKFGVSTGATYSGTPNYAAATVISAPDDVQTNIPNTGATYTIRFFNGADNCFKDSTVTVAAVVCTPPCSVTSVTATPGACNPTNNKYDVSGQISFTNPPADGILTARIKGKGFQVFNAPFVSPLGYLLSGLNADGLSDTVEVSFSKSICTGSAIYTSPVMCLPDVCTSPETGGVETFKFAIPLSTTNWTKPLVLPKFDAMGGTRILKNVLLTANQTIQNWGIVESTDSEPSAINILTNGFTLIKLGVDTIATNSFLIQNIPSMVTAGIPVPAQGGWMGDNVDGSTLRAMTFIAGALASQTDPRLDPNWVTTLTGNPVHDDDIAYFAPFNSEKSSCWQFNTPTGLMQFIGTGNLSMTAVAKGAGSVEGPGNFESSIRTAASAEVTITYLFCNAVVCTQPSAINLTKTAPTCAAGVAQNDGKITLTAISNADKFGVSAGAIYSGTPNYAAATAIGPLPQDLQTSIPNAGGIYTIRFFNGADDCFKDSTVVVLEKPCPNGCPIDSLTTDQTVIISFASDGPASSFASGPDMLGGERDMELVQVNDPNGSFFSADVVNGGGFGDVLSFSNPVQGNSMLTITYDGADANAALNPTGLGGVDMSSGENFSFELTHDSPAGGLKLLHITYKIYTDAANWSQRTVVINEAFAPGINFKTFVVTPASFTIGGGTGADFSNVGAVQLVIAPQVDADDLVMRQLLGPCVPPVTCIQPTAITLTKTAPTCAAGVAQNDGKIILNSITDADKFGVSTGATYSGTPNYAAATAIGALPQDLQTAIPNAGATYTIRFFNGADDCFKDSTVTVAPNIPPVVTARDTVVCAGNPVNLGTLFTHDAQAGTITYYDNLNAALAATPTISSTVSPTATDQFYIRKDGTGGCFGIDSTEITVSQPVSAGTATNPADICAAATGLSFVNLFAQTAGETAGGIWTKTSGPAVGINFDAGAGTLDPNGLAAGSYVFQYAVTGTAPCPNDSEPVTVTITNCTLPCPPKVCLPVTIEKVVGGN